MFVAHRSYNYEGCGYALHLKRKLKYAGKVEVAAGWLLYHNQYVRKYYNECYGRDVHMHNLEI